MFPDFINPDNFQAGPHIISGRHYYCSVSPHGYVSCVDISSLHKKHISSLLLSHQLHKDRCPTSVCGLECARIRHFENGHSLGLHQESHTTLEVSIDRDFFPSGSEGLPPSVRDLLLFECGSRKIEDQLCEMCRGGTFHSTKSTSAPSSLSAI